MMKRLVTCLGVFLFVSTVSGQPIKSWYNGYSPFERSKKLAVMNKMLARGEMAEASGPCMLCGDPEVEVEYHSEDYGEPFLWDPPAVYSLCKTCHRFKLHGRFTRSEDWQTYVAHVRRGGYARDLKVPEIARELRLYREALKRGETPEALTSLRPYEGTVGEEWFVHIRMDRESLKDPTARPRYPNDFPADENP